MVTSPGQNKKDLWDVLDIIAKAFGSILIPLAIVSLGYFGNQALQSRQASDAQIRLYSELMSKREDSETSLRRDIFRSILESFLSDHLSSLSEKISALEVLAYNFQESINLKPVFLHIKKDINNKIVLLKQKNQLNTINNNNGEDPIDSLEKELFRLEKMSRELSKKQRHILEQVGEKFDRTIEFKNLSDNGSVPLPLEPAILTLKNNEILKTNERLKNNERQFRITVLETDILNRRIRVQIMVDIINSNKSYTLSQFQESWIGFFDFPIVENYRLSNDERYAIVLNEFDENQSVAEITVVYFPGSYASLKEKTFFEEIINKLKIVP